MFALADDLIGKSNGRIFTAGRSNTAGDLDKFVSGTIEKAKMGYLRARLEPLRNGAAHVVHAISASPRDRGVEGVPQGGALRLADRKRDRVLGSRKIPLGDFGSQPSLLVGCQGMFMPPPWQNCQGFPSRTANPRRSNLQLTKLRR
jgi:hypothetical protein